VGVITILFLGYRPAVKIKYSCGLMKAIEQGNRCFENSELLISYITLSYRYNNKCQYAYRDAYYIIDIYCI
ncbi:hypothetical protein, partial [Escherichia coli]|uniref:hypothetical protein n=1 Tax=Escherichia coli TaxID=562 RepID=UPI0019651BB0